MTARLSATPSGDAEQQASGCPHVLHSASVPLSPSACTKSRASRSRSSSGSAIGLVTSSFPSTR